MSLLLGKCTECDEITEVNRPHWYDGPDICECCRAIDSFDFDFEEDENE